MSHFFKRVVVLLNDLEKIDNLLKKAFNFSIQHQTTLEILYVQEQELFEIPDYFLSDDTINNERLDKKSVKAKIEEHLLALDIQGDHAILIYEDDTVEQVLHYAKGQKDILFITAYHQEFSEKLVEKTPHSFWMLKNEIHHYNNIAIPLDLKEKGSTVVELAKDIFPTQQMTIIYDYRYLLDMMSVQIDYLNVVPVITPDVIALNKELKRNQKKKLEAYKREFEIQAECIDGTSSLDKDLIEYIAKKDFDLTILYHQDTELFLSPLLILTLLKELKSDLFIVNF